MIRAFWFITARSFKNRVILRVRRLRQPRYLIGFIAGQLWSGGDAYTYLNFVAFASFVVEFSFAHSSP